MKPTFVIATIIAGLLTTACSNSPSSTGSVGSGSSPTAGTPHSSQLLAFAQCMRSQGIPNFPGPASDDKFPSPQQLKVSQSQYQAAMNECRHLLPNGGSGGSQAQLQQEASAMLPFAQCMRSQGMPNWPDPTIYTNPAGETAVVFNVLGRNGLDHGGINSPQVQAAEHQCHHLLPSSFDHFHFVSN